MTQDSYGEILRGIRKLRLQLDAAFSPETAHPNTPAGGTPSAGHCAAVAWLVQQKFGGELVSTTVNGVSHWFNRIRCHQGTFDFDLTGDQFGRTPILVDYAGNLYENTRVRDVSELNDETLRRAHLLRSRLGARTPSTHML